MALEKQNKKAKSLILQNDVKVFLQNHFQNNDHMRIWEA